jgi:hypothetical protein
LAEGLGDAVQSGIDTVFAVDADQL